MLSCGAAFADKPSWSGGGKANKHPPREWAEPHHDRYDRHERKEHARGGGPGEARERGYFDDRRRAFIHDYYAERFRAGDCPPGLARKHNGCLPPGQARKWMIGRPLPRDAVYYDLPPVIISQLGLPPPGYRYVRVANDVLLIATGTRMVMDAIRDLGGL
jgi:Ni/Co efflux regulator RcnB